METKRTLRHDGCFGRALQDEPFIVLLARDPAAPGAIRHWCELRAQLSVEGEKRQDADQLTDAFETADAMEQWREKNEGRWHKDEGLWFIWSNEHGRWWKSGWAGYTGNIAEAGVYPTRAALIICRDSNFAPGMQNEVMVPAIMVNPANIMEGAHNG